MNMPLKVALSGFGTSGGARLAGYRSVAGAEVVAVVDPGEQARARAAQLLDGGRVFGSLEELLASPTGAAPDVVDICSPPVFHVPQTRAALAAGAHVICEKPVAVTGEEARGLVELARSRGRLLFPFHNYGTSPVMRELSTAVEEAGIGRLESAVFRILRDRHARGVAGFAPDWRRSRELAGGGILLDHGTHCVYMALRLFGRPPKQVSCTVGRAGGDPAAVDEEARLRLDFGDSHCDIELSWTSGVRSNHYSVHGSGGWLRIDDGVVESAAGGSTHRRNLVSPSKDQTHLEWFPPMYREFRGVLADPVSWHRPATEIVETARVVECAYASAAAGGPEVPL
ncbi:Gfo/Idh/MocA family oxidoreductase [Streptomyces sp. P38-E01]|uniref:Gfo/Idh/MocA family oxidoreductase n=2 Tax=Streptomyces tardus TaxID=2780544 RepID=A0A949JC26_9ACTN|nr:Gfo/Idh/MocA family oxidoreductase [Streptomyces tardus]